MNETTVTVYEMFVSNDPRLLHGKEAEDYWRELHTRQTTQESYSGSFTERKTGAHVQFFRQTAGSLTELFVTRETK